MIWPWSLWVYMCTFSWHAQPDLVLVFPTHHTFIHDNEDSKIRISLVFMGIYMYTFIYFGIHKLWFGPCLFPTLPHIYS